MQTVGVLAKFLIKPGYADEFQRFVDEGLLVVETQPPTTMWFGFRVSDTEYGAFAAFANEADREALLAAGGPKIAQRYGHMFAAPLSFDKVELVASRVVTRAP